MIQFLFFLLSFVQLVSQKLDFVLILSQKVFNLVVDGIVCLCQTFILNEFGYVFFCQASVSLAFSALTDLDLSSAVNDPCYWKAQAAVSLIMLFYTLAFKIAQEIFLVVNGQQFWIDILRQMEQACVCCIYCKPKQIDPCPYFYGKRLFEKEYVEDCVSFEERFPTLVKKLVCQWCLNRDIIQYEWQLDYPTWFIINEIALEVEHRKRHAFKPRHISVQGLQSKNSHKTTYGGTGRKVVTCTFTGKNLDLPHKYVSMPNGPVKNMCLYYSIFIIMYPEAFFIKEVSGVYDSALFQSFYTEFKSIIDTYGEFFNENIRVPKFSSPSDIKQFYDQIWNQKFKTQFPYKIFNVIGEDLGPLSLVIKDEGNFVFHVYMSMDIFDFKYQQALSSEIPREPKLEKDISYDKDFPDLQQKEQAPQQKSDSIPQQKQSEPIIKELLKISKLHRVLGQDVQFDDKLFGLNHAFSYINQFPGQLKCYVENGRNSIYMQEGTAGLVEDKSLKVCLELRNGKTIFLDYYDLYHPLSSAQIVCSVQIGVRCWLVKIDSGAVKVQQCLPFSTRASPINIQVDDGSLLQISCDVYTLDKVKHTCSIVQIKDVEKRNLYACRLMALSGYATQTSFSRNIEYNDPYQESFKMYYEALEYCFYQNQFKDKKVEQPVLRKQKRLLYLQALCILLYSYFMFPVGMNYDLSIKIDPKVFPLIYNGVLVSYYIYLSGFLIQFYLALQTGFVFVTDEQRVQINDFIDIDFLKISMSNKNVTIDRPIFVGYSSSVLHENRKDKLDLSMMNKFVIRDFKCVDNLLEVLDRFCTCSKAVIKRVISNIPDIGSLNILSYCGCAKNVLSAVCGRHGHSKLFMNPFVGKQFQKFLKRKGTTYYNLLEFLLNDNNTITFSDYIKHVAEYDSKKAQMYQKAFDDYCAKYELPHYKVFAKPGEWFEQKHGVDPASMSNRSRLIHNPPEFVKALGGYINFIMMNGLKTVTDSYIGGLSPQEGESLIWHYYKTFSDPIAISIDGKSHDSNQHLDLLKIVDFELIKKSNVCFQADIPCYVSYEIQDILTSDYASVAFYMKDNAKKIFRAFSYKVFGTVYSGDPTRTTFGNSLRVICYMEFILWLARIKKYKIFVAGDDVLLIIDRQNLSVFQKYFWRIYSDKEYGVHGLGQCCKKIDVLDCGMIDVLSRIGHVDPVLGCNTYRNANRMVVRQVQSDSRASDLIVQQGLYASLYFSNLNLSIIRNCLQWLPKPFDLSFKMISNMYLQVSSYYRRLVVLWSHDSTPSGDDWEYNWLTCNLGDHAGCDPYYTFLIAQGLRDSEKVLDLGQMTGLY